MNSYACPGSGRHTGGWPGDSDVCPICERYVVVGQDGTLRKHQVRSAKAAATVAARVFQERQAARGESS